MKKMQKALDLGADDGVNYTQADWPEQVRRLSQGGVEVVLDSVGAATLNQGLDLLMPGGRVVTFGFTSGANLNFELRQIYHKQISILGTTMGSPAEFAQLLKAVESGQIKPVIDRIFSLHQAGAARQWQEQYQHFGKIILAI
jgi:NADPH:quinone reductase-like Zn-dependent oxidoreductase